MKFLRLSSILLFAALIAAFLATPITTISYSIWLVSLDMPMTLGLFISSLIHDWLNLGVVLLLLFLIGFLIAFLITALIRKYFKVTFFSESMSYGIAGASTIFLILYLTVELIFQTQIIGGNRYMIGFLAHICAGFVGGYFFGTFLKKV